MSHWPEQSTSLTHSHSFPSLPPPFPIPIHPIRAQRGGSLRDSSGGAGDAASGPPDAQRTSRAGRTRADGRPHGPAAGQPATDGPQKTPQRLSHSTRRDDLIERGCSGWGSHSTRRDDLIERGCSGWGSKDDGNLLAWV